MEETKSLFKGAKRLERMSMSMIRTVMDRSKAMAGEGLPIISMVAGEPNFNTPQAVKDAVIRAIQENYTHYGSNRGMPELRGEIAKRTREDTGLDYDSETEILVTSGGAEAINNALLAVLDPGDEVIVFSPAFVNYENVAKLAGANVVFIPLKKENGFQIDVEEVRAKLTVKTKLIVLNNPCNPTGVLYSRETLEALSRLICDHNLLAFSDEIYSNLVYGGRQFVSLASLPGMQERTIVMNGFSKTYAMTGWRLGYLCADRRMMPNLIKIHQYSTTCSPTFIQVGLAASMNLPETRRDVAAMTAEFAQRRELVLKLLDSIPKLSCVPPTGAFYFFLDVSATGLSGEEFGRRLLEEKYVAAVPGIGMGRECTDFLRISYAVSREALTEGFRRIRGFTESL